MSLLVVRRTARLGAIAIATTAWLVLGTGLPVQAHAQLVGSTPPAGASLATPPAEVELEFSEELLDLGGMIVVTDDAERSWVDGELVIEGTRARVALATGMPDGRYAIRWQVVSHDGHPISGTIPFTVGDVAALPPAGPSVDVSAPDSAGSAETPDGVAVLRPVLIGLIGAAVAVTGYWLILRRRRRDAAPHTDELGSP